MLNRSRFIQGKGPQSRSKGKKRNDQTPCKDTSFSSRGVKGKSQVAPPTSLRESLELLNQKSNGNGNSSRVAEKWLVGENVHEGYSIEVPTRHNYEDSDFDCSDSVSSLNDSIYFGGGASVTGGYSSRPRSALDLPTHQPPGNQNHRQSNAIIAPRGSPLHHAKSLVVGIVPGSSADVPINLLSTMTRPKNDDFDDEEDIVADVDGDDIMTVQLSSLPQKVADESAVRRLCEAEDGRGDGDDQESAAVFTAAQSEAVDDVEEFYPALLGSPSAFQKMRSHDGTTALSPASAASRSEEECDAKTNPSSFVSGGCVYFIKSAPNWLKVVFILSILALIGALVLLTVGLTVARDIVSDSSNSAAVQQQNNPKQSSSAAKTSAPTAEFLPLVITKTPPTLSPVKILKTISPSRKPVLATKESKRVPVVQTPSPTPSPTADDEELVSNDSASEGNAGVRTAFPIAPTQSPIPVTAPPTTLSPIDSELSLPSPTKSPTLSPSAGDSGESRSSKWTIYLTTGRFSDDLRQDVTTSMDSILTDDETDSSTLLVHLGDWGDAANCDEASFQSISELFQVSPVPVYFVVGANEYNDCSDPESAKTLWNSYLLNFETEHWPRPPWTIFREGDSSVEFAAYSENFLFQHDSAVFMSINLGNAETDNPSESQPRLEANMAWIDSAYKFYHDIPTISTIFIFADDGPGFTSNVQFFQELLERIISYSDIDFVFVSRGAADWNHTEQYQDIINLDVVQVIGPIWPPLRMTVEFDGATRSIKLDDAW